MSKVTQPRISLPYLVRPRRTAWLGALLALAAASAMVLIFVLGNESSERDTTGRVGVQPSLRTDGGPEESSVAASVGSRPTVGPNEARIAASIGGSKPQASSGPDESRTAAAISGSSVPRSTGPDESHTAASISGR